MYKPSMIVNFANTHQLRCYHYNNIYKHFYDMMLKPDGPVGFRPFFKANYHIALVFIAFKPPYKLETISVKKCST